MIAKDLMNDYPPTPDKQVTLANWRQSPFNSWSYRNVRRLLPTANIAATHPGKPFETALESIEDIEFVGIGGAGPLIVGSPQRVADELEKWMEDTGVDGFNLMYTVMPECMTDFVDLVVPELQQRGVYKADYTPGTLREKLLGGGARTSLPHPSAVFRANAAELAGAR